MQLESLITNILKSLGFFVIAIGILFLFAKMTHQTLVISSSHIYLGGTSEIVPTSGGY